MFTQRFRFKILLGVIIGLSIVGVPGRARAAAEIVITNPSAGRVVSESNDFAVMRFSDPWDMNRRMDLSYGQYMNDLTNVRFRRGIFSARTTGTDAHVYPLHPGYEGVVFNGRDGYINRIGTSKYNSFSIRMYSSRRTSAQLFWFYNQRWTRFGSVTWRVKPGWHTYVINLKSNSQWTGKPMGLRFDPTPLRGVNFKIDWMRLFKKRRTRVLLNWTDSKPRGTTEIYLDTDRDPRNGNMELIAAQNSKHSNSYSFDPAPYYPGSYYLLIKKSGQAGVYSSRIVINQQPLLKILQPDEKGGRDYARRVTGDAWDMSQSSDVWYWKNMRDVVFSKGVMAGTPTNGDSYFHLRVPKTINTGKYHRLTFRFRYDGSFDYGAGTMSRVIWSADHNRIGLFQTINDIVTYPTWNVYTIDLKKASIDAGSIGWNGPVNDFRFDPLEWRARRRFYIDYIQLRADDHARRRFRIKWKDLKNRRQRKTKVDLYYDTNRKGYNGRPIVKNLNQTIGKNSYRWRTKSVPNGTYYIYAVARDGVSRSRRYSSGPVKIKH